MTDTGTWLWNITNVPSGRRVMGPDGEYLQYVMANAGNTTNPAYYLSQWNSTRLIMSWGTGIRPTWTGTSNASDLTSYDWNISIPWRNTMPNSPTIIAAYY